MTSCLHYPGCEHWPPDQAWPTRRSVAPLPEEERNQWGPAAARRWFELRDRVAGCEPRYRLASAIGDVAGFGSKDYSALTNLVNLLKAHPDAKPTAVWQRAEFSEESVTRSAAMVRRVLAALNGIEHEAPAELLDALAAYAAEAERRWQPCEHGGRISSCYHWPRCSWPAAGGWRTGAPLGRWMPA